ALFQGNHYNEDQMEYRDPAVAPSPCLMVANTISARVVGEAAFGASGSGLEAQHPVDLIVTGGGVSRNGGNGITLLGGHDNVVGGGVILRNNGQWVNIPFVQDYQVRYGTGAGSGIMVSGSATFGQPGQATNCLLGNIICSDSQATPTQRWGVAYQGTSTGTIN